MSRHAAARAPSRAGGRLATLVTVLMVVVGAAGLALGYTQWRSASAQPPEVAGATANPVSQPGTPAASRMPNGGLALARSVPVHLTVPAIGVNTPLMKLGLNPDNTVQVPPIEKDSPAGWYEHSPTPGELGPSIILGHVTIGQFGDGVFLKLATLHAGDRVDVTRADGSVAEFSVDKVAEYPKSAFPTQEVYGNIDHAGLRLITCGGAKNLATHTYPDNVVVFASLVSAKGATA